MIGYTLAEIRPSLIRIAKSYCPLSENPNFTLVVGNYENVDAKKVAEARRRFPDVQIIDYDSLLQLYLIRKDALPDQLG